MDSQRSLGKSEELGKREKLRVYVAGLNNLDMSGENVTVLASGYIANLEAVFVFEEQIQIAKTALLNIGNLKDRFDGYLHVICAL